MSRLIISTNQYNGKPENIKGRSSGIRVSLLFAGLILGLIFIPSFQVVFGYRLFRYIVAIFVLWLIIIHFESPGILRRVFRNRFGELVLYGYWCAIVFLYAWMSSASSILPSENMGSLINRFYTLSLITSCYVIGMTYATETDGNAFRWLIRFLLLAVGVNALLALPSLLNPGLAAREYINTYQTTPLPGTGQQNFSVYGLGSLGLYMIEALLAPYFLTIVLEAKGIVRLIYVSLFVMITVNVFLCSILLVQIAFISGVTIFSLWKMIQIKTPVTTRLGFIALALLLVFLGYWLSNTPAGSYSMDRIIKYITPHATYRVQGDTLDDRKNDYLDSINAFLEHPVLGAGFAAYIGKVSSNLRIGGHSGILDGLAMYGLLFSIYPLFIWIKYRHLRKLFLQSKQDMWLFSGLVCFLTYLIINLSDPMIFNASLSGIFFFAIIGRAVPKLKQ